MLPKVWHCLAEKIRNCPKSMAAQMYEGMEPGLWLLQKMCRKMPKFACVSSLVWKTAGIMVTTEEIGTMGAHAQALRYMMDMHNKNMTDDKKPTTAPERSRREAVSTDKSIYNADKEKQKLFALHFLKKMIEKSKKPDCDMEDDMEDGSDKMNMDKDDSFDFLKGMIDVFKYVRMDSKVIKEDKDFKQMMQLHLLKLGKMKDTKDDQNYDILGMLMKHIVAMETADNKNMTWDAKNTTHNSMPVNNNNSSKVDAMKMDFQTLMSMVLKQVIAMEDSEKLLKYVFHQMTTAKLHKMMEEFKNKDTKRMNDDMKDDMMKLREKIEESSKKMMSRDKNMAKDLKEGMAMMVKEIIKGNNEFMKNYNDSGKMMEILHKYMEMKMKQKKSMCMELWEASKCVESMMVHVPRQMRRLVNMTLHVIIEVGKEYCQRKLYKVLYILMKYHVKYTRFSITILLEYSNKCN